LGDGAAGVDGVERGMERIPVKRKLKDINEHLLCVLCSGYMIDPTAAIECLHTFCRKCIVEFMESSKTCPRCDVLFHLTNPLLGIRSDRTLQTIIYKLVPGLYEEEIKRRCTAANMAISAGKDSGTVERIMENIQDATKGITIYTGEEKFSLSVRLDGSAPTVDLTKSKRHSVYLTRKKRQALKSPKIDRVYFLCPSAFTIGQLKKLLYLKFTIDLDFPVRIVDIFNSFTSISQY
jgi:polycomb group RING finger protein 4